MTGKACVTKEDVTGIPTRVKEIRVEDWNAEVYIRAVNSFEHEQLIGSTKDKDEQAGRMYYQRLACSLFLSDEKGRRLFTDSEADLKAIGEKSTDGLSFVLDQGMAFNGMTTEGAEEVEKK